MTQGERVRSVRKELNLTLEKFGEKLGVSKGAISAIEIGTRNLTEQMTKSICREYNVNYDYLVNGEGEMFDDLPQTVLDELCMQYDCDDFDRVLIEEYLKLNTNDKQIIKNFIKNICKNI
nr:MAG: helix-turn-helix domain protein [Bacteriophage sp.]